ncbi:NfeD family protein [Mucilaginibacter phyllosphaerae]|uniref:Uncharacterized protein n=1 Tax=Mucilaginibacter phyllosphaerae TaxID=1812349 RepID=A0A4Y8AHQ1_9SPHI|nr:hypothetical protein [Mucilaginibacter phyllosphaerae]MBB3971340.1 hypothetical protein [Mucilaginibacter phyllosphaerae]TEW68607.1 hypothetical protein E2R65_00110 [Mucilaginibacter phyllosphaerae]
MSIPVDWLIFIISSIACIFLSIRWYKKSDDKTEPAIALIGFITTFVLFFFNEYNADRKTQELITINKRQMDVLQDTLLLQIKHNDSLTKQLEIYRNQTSVQGNDNVVIQGNYGSQIQIGRNEKPDLEEVVYVNSFLNSDIPVIKGDKINITATGSISVGPVVGHSGPNGKESGVGSFSLEDYNIVPAYRHAALMYKLSEEDEWTECGDNFSFEADKDGSLIFQINDNAQSNNSGAYKVTVKKYKASRF